MPRRARACHLQGSPLDLRRKTPVPAGTNTDTSPPRLLRNNPLDTSAAVPQLTAPLAPGLQLPSLSKISNVSSCSTNAGNLSEEYSTEAELIGRQIGMLVHLMQVASTAAAAAAAATKSAAGSSSSMATVAEVAVMGASSREGSSNGSGQEVGPASMHKGSQNGVSAAAVLRRYSSNGARSNKGQLSADVLEAASQLLSIQVGGKTDFPCQSFVCALWCGCLHLHM